MSSLSDAIVAALLVLINLIMSTVVLVIVLLDELSFGQLLILTLILRLAAQHVPSAEAPIISSRLAAPVMLAYFGYGAVQVGDEVWLLVVTFLRSLLVYHIVWSVLVPIVAFATAITVRFRYTTNTLKCYTSSVFAGIAKAMRYVISFRRHRPLPAVVYQPSPPRSERMRNLAQAAQADFESEAALLQTLPLDDDERDVLILQAKQRLLQKLSHLPEV